MAGKKNAVNNSSNLLRTVAASSEQPDPFASLAALASNAGESNLALYGFGGLNERSSGWINDDPVEINRSAPQFQGLDYL